MLDMSDFLLHHKGALPVPTIITAGGRLSAWVLGCCSSSQSLADRAAEAHASGEGPAPPNITGIGGAYTENGTWAAGLAHFHTWQGDRIRYLGAIAKVSANPEYFGVSNQPRHYSLDGVFLVQQVLFRACGFALVCRPALYLFRFHGHIQIRRQRPGSGE